MATPVWQEAWDCFLKALDARYFPPRYLPIPPEDDRKFFKQVVRAVRQIGIKVKFIDLKFTDPDIEIRDNGGFSLLTGVTEYQGDRMIPKPRDIIISISPCGKNSTVICHEFAHAADFLLHGFTSRFQMETIAEMASYLFTCRRFGTHSSKFSTEHCRQLGINSQDVRKQKRRVLAVFRKMNSLYKKGGG